MSISVISSSTEGTADVIAPPVAPARLSPKRPEARGKFIFAGDEKLYIRGVTYGPFKPTAEGCEYHDEITVRRDFERMHAAGINCVRTYTVPPRWLLDLAAELGLWVMVGMPWEQHIAFLDSPQIQQDIERRVAQAVRECAEHPAILCYAIGNEIPSHIARWHGRKGVEQFLHRLYRACKQEDPHGLVTYANYPSTEYLDLPFLDIVSFNVYLETQSKLEAYLARLQNIANERPLLVAELGLDSLHHGTSAQASTLDWQIRTVFGAGVCGTFVFSWTDEWFRGGMEVEGWEFGLTTRDRQPKPALDAVRGAFADIPFPPQVQWPRISVVVCTYNGSRTIRRCLEGIGQIDYPNYEIIVVDDGSTDGAGEIASGFAVKLIRTENRGLSSARNTGMRAASGEIVAYIDDDAWPDPQWLKYLAMSFARSSHAGIGGPNIPPIDEPPAAQAVAHSPGGPSHVLLTDTVAEHIPGCNMAFRKSALEEIGGFDEQFRIAGDDVDVCWRLQHRGWTLGFSPAATVWHLRRSGVGAYWRQQRNYGRAEAMLERKWPEKYNAMGSPTWSGRLYGRGILQTLGLAPGRIYHGTWGSALFQSVYHTAPTLWHALPTTPEWYLILAVLGGLGLLSIFWPMLLLAVAALAIAASITILQSITSAARAFPQGNPRTDSRLWHVRLLTTWLHLLQPAARLMGKIQEGLTPWRRHGPRRYALPWSRRCRLWTGQWRWLEDRLRDLEQKIRSTDAVVVRGGDYDDWDLEIRGGMLGSVRVKLTVEEHGDGMQMVRLRARPRCDRIAGALAVAFIVISDLACLNYEWETWAVAGLAGTGLLVMIIRDICGAMGVVAEVTSEWERE